MLQILMKVADQQKEKMMGSIRRRDVAIRAAAMAMLEEGKVLSKRDFDNITKPTGIRSGNLMNLFGSWSRLCLLYTSPSPRDRTRSRMPSSA